MFEHHVILVLLLKCLQGILARGEGGSQRCETVAFAVLTPRATECL
jgi:hypothetical protein